MELSDLGWNKFFETHFEHYLTMNYSPLRISRENREQYMALSGSGELTCEVSGRFRFDTTSKSGFPAVGDWVAASIHEGGDSATIHAVLPRKSSFSRKVAGQVTDEQIVAANVDTIFIVTGLDDNYNLRRIERYLSMAWSSGAMPVIVLNKSDICPDAESRRLEVELATPGVDVCTLSASHNTGFESITRYIVPGRTVAFLGSSGVGKSSIINTLLGTNRQKVNEVSDLGSRGRHTTTFRELIVLPDGGIVIDTPGMRELQVWGDDEGLKQVFTDIDELSMNCRFTDCTHENEPGCAVLEAVDDGILDPERLQSYYKLKKEFAYLADRQEMKASQMEKAKNKDISKEIKRYFKGR